MSRAERIILVGALLNFFAAFAMSMWLGGDAVQGKVEGGRHFLGHKGTYREVSAALFGFSLFQIASLFVTHPLAMLATWRGQRRAKQELNPKA